MSKKTLESLKITELKLQLSVHIKNPSRLAAALTALEKYIIPADLEYKTFDPVSLAKAMSQIKPKPLSIRYQEEYKTYQIEKAMMTFMMIALFTIAHTINNNWAEDIENQHLNGLVGFLLLLATLCAIYKGQQQMTPFLSGGAYRNFQHKQMIDQMKNALVAEIVRQKESVKDTPQYQPA